MATRIVSCSCVHPFQDERYGPGQRLAVSCKSSQAGVLRFRCTVCGKVHEFGGKSPPGEARGLRGKTGETQARKQGGK